MHITHGEEKVKKINNVVSISLGTFQYGNLDA